MNLEERIQAEIDSWSGAELITISEDTLRAFLHRRTIVTLTGEFDYSNPYLAIQRYEAERHEWQVDIIIYGLKAANTPRSKQTLTLCIDTLRHTLSYGNILKLWSAISEDEDDENYPSYQKLVEDIISKLKDKQHNNPANGSGSESGVETWHARK